MHAKMKTFFYFYLNVKMKDLFFMNVRVVKTQSFVLILKFFLEINLLNQFVCINIAFITSMNAYFM